MKEIHSRNSLGRRKALELLGVGAGMLALRHELGIVERLEAMPAPQGTRIPNGAIIRTVLKDVSPDALKGGTTLMHEHVVGGFYSSPPRPAGAPRSEVKEDIDLIVDELMASKKDGLVGIVDAAIGRRPAPQFENLKTIANRTGVHIVLAGGYYRAPYPAGVIDRTEEQIADEFVGDAQAQRWGAFGEIGSGMETHPDERKMMRAVARAHHRLGIPIFTHTPHESCQKCAIDQLEIYESEKVDPRNLCIGHLSDLKDDPKAQTPIAVAKRGAFIGFDTVGHELGVSKTSLVTDRIKLNMLLATLDAGYEDYVLLSSDMAHNNQLKANWGEGFSAVHKTFVGKMQFAGVKDATIRKILHDNPRRFLAFVPKTS
jgi:phosphotriesterase-related protein